MRVVEDMGARSSGTKKPAKFRVLLVEPHVVVRQGIAGLIDREADLLVCGGVSESAAALKAIVELKPDIALVDITLKSGNGLELIKVVTSQYPKLPVLVLSMHDELLFAEIALRSGALGYIMKEAPIDKLLAAIRRVLSKDIYLSEGVTSQMLRQQFRGPKKMKTLKASPIELLSDRELQIFQMMGEWKGLHDIAKALHLSVKTVEYHLRRIKEKLHLKDAKDLLHVAVACLEGSHSTPAKGKEAKLRGRAKLS